MSTVYGEEKPYKIAVSDEAIKNLNDKLALYRLPDELEGAGNDYGIPLDVVKRLVDRWRNGFDWRAQEKHINDTLPQFTRDITVDDFGSLNIHYVHQKSKIENAIPLIFVHGWPGSFLEVSKILPLLTQAASNGEHPSFHVVALSLPGFGFSEAPKKKGFHARQFAEVAHKLMLSLGYNEYVSQGGDIGFFVVRYLAANYGGKHNKAWHTNFGPAPPPTLSKSPLAYLQNLISPLSEREVRDKKRDDWFIKTASAYRHEHATRPQTIGYSFADSPVGLLGWIGEKLRDWTDDYPWEDDEFLTWISVYWFSRAGPAAAIRWYYEQTKESIWALQNPTIPFGVSRFPRELTIPRILWVKNTGNVVAVSEHDKGGHFAAHEQPEALVNDIRNLFAKNGPAFGVVAEHDGYPAKL